MVFKVLEQLAAQFAPAIANHLWQSTLFAAAIALVTLAFRRTQARVRFALWLAASIKFFVPFGLLIAAGNRLATAHAAPGMRSDVSATVEMITQPFARTGSVLLTRPTAVASVYLLVPAALTVIWLLGTVTVISLWAWRWSRVAAQMRRATTIEDGREAEALNLLKRNNRIPTSVPLLLSAESMEPGVFGILRPALLWPAGISVHLDDAQLEAILAHEAGHILRRDNLTAAMHMLVEAVFWFHPLVWWLGTRLMAERERACDEAVLASGNDPSVYAESILRACKFCVEAPLPCVAGVSGSNLKRRIVRIMNQQTGNPLTTAGKFLLGAVATATLAVPVAFGVLHAPLVAAQEVKQDLAIKTVDEFQDLTVKPSTSADAMAHVEIHPGLFVQKNETLRSMIAMAYGVQDYQIAGAPDWAATDRFDIEAKWKAEPGFKTDGAGVPPPPPPPPAPPAGSANILMVARVMPDSGITPPVPGQLHQMMRTLLAKQFNLKLTNTSQELPAYDLVVSGTGARLTPTATAPSDGKFRIDSDAKTMISVSNGADNGEVNLTLNNVSADVLAHILAQQVHRQVSDKTGLKGMYDVSLHWEATDDPEAIAAAIEDQIGLKLEAVQAPTAVLVVNQVEKPAGD